MDKYLGKDKDKGDVNEALLTQELAAADVKNTASASDVKGGRVPSTELIDAQVDATAALEAVANRQRAILIQYERLHDKLVPKAGKGG